MKTHPALKQVLAAARKQVRLARDAEKLEAAIGTVDLFVTDNHDFIEFYNKDAGLTAFRRKRSKNV